MNDDVSAAGTGNDVRPMTGDEYLESPFVTVARSISTASASKTSPLTRPFATRPAWWHACMTRSTILKQKTR